MLLFNRHLSPLWSLSYASSRRGRRRREHGQNNENHNTHVTFSLDIIQFLFYVFYTAISPKDVLKVENLIYNKHERWCQYRFPSQIYSASSQNFHINPSTALVLMVISFSHAFSNVRCGGCTLSALTLTVHVRSGPRANIMRNCIAQLCARMSINDIMYIHHENGSLIQNRVLMRSATRTSGLMISRQLRVGGVH